MEVVKISQLTSSDTAGDVATVVGGESKKYNLGNLQTAVGQIASTCVTRENADAKYVDKTTAQTISGLKTFSNGLKIGASTLAYDTTNQCITITFD